MSWWKDMLDRFRNTGVPDGKRDQKTSTKYFEVAHPVGVDRDDLERLDARVHVGSDHHIVEVEKAVGIEILPPLLFAARQKPCPKELAHGDAITFPVGQSQFKPADLFLCLACHRNSLEDGLSERRHPGGTWPARPWPIVLGSFLCCRDTQDLGR